MNIFKWLGKAGRVSTAALLGAGGVAVVGGLGAAALLMSGGQDDNTSFTDLNYERQNNVVYTAGSNVGYNYSKDASGEKSLISARNINYVDQADYAAEQNRQFEMQNQEMQRAYSMSQDAEGLANGAVDETEGLGGMFGMGAPDNLKEMVSGMQNAMGDVAKQAAAGQAGTEGQKTDGQLARATVGNWSNSSATQGSLNPHVGGHSGSGGSQWTPGAGESAAAQVGNALEKAQSTLSNLEGARLSGRGFTPNKATFGNPLDSSGKFAGMGQEGQNRLVYAQKKAAETARNKHREANSLGKGFLDGDKISGGITIEGTGITTGEGQESADFGNKFAVAMNNVGAALDAVQEQARDREADGHSLKNTLWKTFAIVLAAAIAIPWLKRIQPPWLGWGLAIIAGLAGLTALALLTTKIVKFSKAWGFTGMAITATAVGTVMAAGLALSFFKSSAWYDIQSKFLGKLGISSATGLSVGLAGGAVYGAASEAIKSDMGTKL